MFRHLLDGIIDLGGLGVLVYDIYPLLARGDPAIVAVLDEALLPEGGEVLFELLPKPFVPVE
jgi:hypothetical protein